MGEQTGERAGGPTISLVVNTRNEARHLPEMLASAAGWDDLVVADMESDDGTVEIARRHGARVLALSNAGCCEPGRQVALDAARGDWILVLDADERLPPPGLEQVRALVRAAGPAVAAFRIPFEVRIGETRIVRSGWEPRLEQHIRLFRRGAVAWPPLVHAVPEVRGQVVAVPGEALRIIHHNFRDLAHFLDKVNRYSTVEALELVASGRRSSVRDGLREAVQELGRRYSPGEDAALSLGLSWGIALYRLFVQLKAAEAEGWPEDDVPSRLAMVRGLEALARSMGDGLERRRAMGAPVTSGDTGTPRPPSVSIVIPVWNKVEYTRACLEALIRNTPGELFEVILVDNASTDGTAEFLALLEGDVKVIRNPENVGFVGACNQGAAVARGKYLLFLNNDTSPQEGWLQALVEMAERDPSVGAVGAKLVYPDGKLQEAGGLVFSDASGWNFGRGDNPFNPRYEQPCEVDYCSGAALLVRRDLFEQLGGFDVRYAPAYYEDTDLCFGVRSLGRKVMYCPKSIVIHHEGATAGTDLASGMKRYQVENRSKFAAKWADALSEQEAPPQISGAVPVTADRARLRRARVEPVGDGPSVLVVDPFMPLHDRASGSLRLFRLLQLMRERGCRVTYIGRAGNGQERYRRELEAMGIDAYAGDADRMRECGRLIDGPRVDLPDLLRRRRFDVAWLSFWYIGEQYLPLVRLHSPSTRVVLDSVDVHFLRERREAELQGQLAARGAELADRERRELAAYSAADAVVTVTEADAAVLRARGLRTRPVVVPNVHARTAALTPPFDDRHGLLFVGNFAHAPNVDAVRWFCADVLPRVRERLPAVRLFVVGGNPPEEIRSLAGPDVVVTGHVPAVEPYLDACRVSIAPLRYGAGMKGKIGEALGRGLPVVTTAIGAEGMGLADREHALIADEPEAFARAVEALYSDRALWVRLSASGMAHVEDRYGPDAVARVLDELLPRGAGSGPAPSCGRAPRPPRAPGEAAAPRAEAALPPTPWQLHVGCNETRLPGFVNVDARHTSATDLVHDCRDLSCCEAETVGFAFSNAFLEHLRVPDRLPFLRDLHRALVPGGAAYFSGIPDFEMVARAYLEERRGHSGRTFDLSEAYRYTHGMPEQAAGWWMEQLHKGLFDAAELRRLLTEARFESWLVFRYAWRKEASPVNLGFIAMRGACADLGAPHFADLVRAFAPVNGVNGSSVQLLLASDPDVERWARA